MRRKREEKEGKKKEGKKKEERGQELKKPAALHECFGASAACASFGPTRAVELLPREPHRDGVLVTHVALARHLLIHSRIRALLAHICI